MNVYLRCGTYKLIVLPTSGAGLLVFSFLISHFKRGFFQGHVKLKEQKEKERSKNKERHILYREQNRQGHIRLEEEFKMVPTLQVVVEGGSEKIEAQIEGLENMFSKSNLSGTKPLFHYLP